MSAPKCSCWLFAAVFSWDDGGGSAEGRNSEAAAAAPDPAAASDAAAQDAAASQRNELLSSGDLPSRPPDFVFTLGGPGGGAGDSAAGTDFGTQQLAPSMAALVSVDASAPSDRAALPSSSSPSGDQPPAAAATAPAQQQQQAALDPAAADSAPGEASPAASVAAAAGPAVDAASSPAEPIPHPPAASADTSAASAAAAMAAASTSSGGGNGDGSSGQASYSFPQFEVADDPVDHHFARETRQPENPRCAAAGMRGFNNSILPSAPRSAMLEQNRMEKPPAGSPASLAQCCLCCCRMLHAPGLRGILCGAPAVPDVQFASQVAGACCKRDCGRYNGISVALTAQGVCQVGAAGV